MASRRALLSGLQRLVRQASMFGGNSSAIMASTTADASGAALRACNTTPSIYNMARGFAAEPAAAAPSAATGRVTQGRFGDSRVPNFIWMGISE
eukprot:jgi/Picsp_1/2798/NSC_01024-R1_---NA---